MDWYMVFLVALGVILQTFLAWHLGRLLFKAGWALACAISVCRWGFAVGSVHGFRCSAWRWVPPLIAREWWSFFTSPYDSISQTCHGGSWKGIGQWWVFQSRSSGND